MRDSPMQGETSGGAAVGLEGPSDRSRSFAELVAALQRLNDLESALASAIANARVPVQEVRKLLASETPDQAENAPSFQFMRQIFAQVGLPLRVESVGRFAITFVLDENPYARLFAAHGSGKTCGSVGEAIGRFLATDFGLPAEVEEVACGNDGGARCRFAAALDPASVRAKAFDGHDWKVLHALRRADGHAPARAALGFEEAEYDFRAERLVGYGIVSADGRVLPEGEALLDAGPHPVEEPFEPPWTDVSRLTAAIAHAQSFAEAVIQVAPRGPGPEVQPDAETAAVAAECRSFAELLARASRERSFE